MFYLNNKRLSDLEGSQPVRKLMYRGAIVWKSIIAALRKISCFGSGYWDNDLPWNNDDAWQ